jgi:hypothetical protein
MSVRDLKPWSLRPLGRALVVLFCVFTAAVLTLMICALPNMRISVVSKGLVALGAVGGLGFALTLLMWHRYWPEVGWDVGFWDFITGPKPTDAYPEAVQAWLWGRRCMHCWFAMVFSVILIPLVETVVASLG